MASLLDPISDRDGCGRLCCCNPDHHHSARFLERTQEILRQLLVYLDDGVAVSILGGTTPYVYWSDSDNQAGPVAIALESGTYTVTVTDDNGCIDSTEVTVGGPVDTLVANFAITSVWAALDVFVDNQSTGGTRSRIIGMETLTDFHLDTFTYNYLDSGAIEIRWLHLM